MGEVPLYCSAKGPGRGLHGVGVMPVSRLQRHLGCKVMSLDAKLRGIPQ